MNLPAATKQQGAQPRTEDWQRAFALLDQALDLDETALHQWKENLAREEADVAAVVFDLLARREHVTTGDFLHEPLRGFREADPPPPIEGAAIGPYRLIREIGRGGTAVVWLAQSTSSLLDRKVALKLPHVDGFRSSAFRERLGREREILASLSHPNIARLFDAGIDHDGRPYLALEYIDGLPLDVFARQRDLPVRDRINLLVSIARAVGHAHAQLIVHRDLKPTNILVDAGGGIHLVDFGIAKLIGDAAPSGEAPLTVAMGRVLTPEYASPEQLQGGVIGTASDVYSLGLVAFELLTGKRANQASGLHASTTDGVSRFDAPLASESTPDAELRRALRGDLDAIIAKSLSPIPSARYATMDALAEELVRYLEDGVVEARSASRGYLARRWFRKHRVEIAVVLLIVFAITGGAYAQAEVAIALALGAIVALGQRNRALKEAEKARIALARSEAVKGFVASLFTQVVPRSGRGGPVAALDLLKDAARRVETDLAGQPAVAAELGALIGASFNEMGDVKSGAVWLPKAVDRCIREFGPRHPLTLQCRRRWIEAANTVGDVATAEVLLPALLRDLRDVKTEPTLLVQTLQSYAFVVTKQQRQPEALEALHEAIDIGVAFAGEASALVLSARVSLSNTHMHFGNYQAAFDAIEKAMSPAYALYGNNRPHLLLTAVERCYGDALATIGRPRDAVGILRQVLRDQRSLDVEETTRLRIATVMLARGLLLCGHFTEALDLFDVSASMHDRLTGGQNHEAVAGWTWLAVTSCFVGDYDGAWIHLERATTIGGPAVRGTAQSRPRLLALAEVRVAGGHAADAIALVDQLLEEGDELTGPTRLRAARIRSMAYQRLHRFVDALAAANTALETVSTVGAALDHGLLAIELARCHRSRDEPEVAADWVRKAFVIWDAGQVDGRSLRGPIEDEFAALIGVGSNFGRAPREADRH